MQNQTLQTDFVKEESKQCHFFNRNNERECPQCGFTTIKGMPGGADSTCKQCGYKDPCCYDY